MVVGVTQVEDYREGREREETEPYAVERIATVLAVTCMFLSALYSIFAVLLFVTSASEHPEKAAAEDSRSKPLVTMTDRKFITMEAT